MNVSLTAYAPSVLFVVMINRAIDSLGKTSHSIFIAAIEATVAVELHQALHVQKGLACLCTTALVPTAVQKTI